uniref:DNA-directed RNA polymerase subunit beta n=1 Tax=Rhizophora mucronata TaxID=61149 RepID=A0A2P2MN86_RHIMU
MNLTHRLLFLSEQRATLSTTNDSPSGPLIVCILGRYFISAKAAADFNCPLVSIGDSLLI